MTSDRYDVWLQALSGDAETEVELARAFKLSSDQVRYLLRSLPAAVKHGVPLHKGETVAARLRELGAQVELVPCVPRSSTPPVARTGDTLAPGAVAPVSDPSHALPSSNTAGVEAARERLLPPQWAPETALPMSRAQPPSVAPPAASPVAAGVLTPLPTATLGPVQDVPPPAVSQPAPAPTSAAVLTPTPAVPAAAAVEPLAMPLAAIVATDYFAEPAGAPAPLLAPAPDRDPALAGPTVAAVGVAADTPLGSGPVPLPSEMRIDISGDPFALPEPDAPVDLSALRRPTERAAPLRRRPPAPSRRPSAAALPVVSAMGLWEQGRSGDWSGAVQRYPGAGFSLVLGGCMTVVLLVRALL